MIVAGRVTVDGQVVTTLGTKVNPRSAEVRLDGRILRPQSFRYVVLNKPSGYITTTSDERGRRTVMDLVDSRERIYPVGRLDRDTEGLLLLTNDGEVANRVMHPRYEMAKEYHVLTLTRPSGRTVQRVRDGIVVDERRVVPDEFRLLRETRDGLLLTMVLHEGMFHVVRRIMEAVGIEVAQLRRVRLGPLALAGLPIGASRELTPGERSTLLEALRIDPATRPPSATPPGHGPIRRPTPPPRQPQATASGGSEAVRSPSTTGSRPVAIAVERTPAKVDRAARGNGPQTIHGPHTRPDLRNGRSRNETGPVRTAGMSQRSGGENDPIQPRSKGRTGKDGRARKQAGARTGSSGGGGKRAGPSTRSAPDNAAPAKPGERRGRGKADNPRREPSLHRPGPRSGDRPTARSASPPVRRSVKNRRHRHDASLRSKRTGDQGERGGADIERTAPPTGGGD